jgi:hypothetical protein
MFIEGMIIQCSGEYLYLTEIKYLEDAENYIMRCFVVYTLHQVLVGLFQFQQNHVGGSCSTHG